MKIKVRKARVAVEKHRLIVIDWYHDSRFSFFSSHVSFVVIVVVLSACLRANFFFVCVGYG